MYKFKITILDITPPIWRTILVPESFSLNKLHHIIQIAFGWTNSHLFCFWNTDILTTDPVLWGGGTTRWDKKVKIQDVLLKIGNSLLYEYGMSDSWRHLIVMEKFEDGGSKTIKWLAGERSAPPEDCVGAHGFLCQFWTSLWQWPHRNLIIFKPNIKQLKSLLYSKFLLR